MADDYQTPSRECDVVMKGGITSGIVYPKAVLRLARTYRFRDVGGASAGAIAAAITAAAEYGRGSGGFDKLAGIPDEMSTNLASLFQPDPRGRALFSLLADGVLEKRWLRVVGLILGQHWLAALPTAAAAVAAGWWAYWGGGLVAGLLALSLGLVVTAVTVGGLFLYRAMCLLPKLDFGLCPGRTQPGRDRPGLSDWLARTIESCAGRLDAAGGLPPRPLTFGELEAHQPPIRLRAVTTNLGLRRPHMLPDLGERTYYFRPEEFRRLFSDWVVDSMTVGAEERDGYYPFPAPEALPVVVAVRMSLSFPLLIAAVPLYRRNYAGGEDTREMQRLLFSDGGLSSNFPIQLFDSLLPGRPTFGISLDDYDPDRPDRRVRLPMRANSGRWLDARSYASLPAFAMGLLNAAKDWQDNLQTLLPGYRERVAHAYLKPDEGGLNLTMPADRIKGLVELGGRAGALMVGGPPEQADDEYVFDFDDHRWRRFLIAYAAIEEALVDAAKDWGGLDRPDSFAAFIDTYMRGEPASYDRTSMAWRQEVFARMDALMTLGRQWQTRELRHQKGATPRPQPILKIGPRF